MAAGDPRRPPWRTLQEEPSAQPPSLGNMLSAIAIAVGVGALGLYMLDIHSHRCEACGNRWRHLGAFNVGSPAAHSCSSCGTVQWFKDGVPHVFRDVLRQPPKPTPAALGAGLKEIRQAPRPALYSATGVAWPREGSR